MQGLGRQVDLFEDGTMHIYEGEFEDDLWNGYRKEKYRFGKTVEGTCKNHRLDGWVIIDDVHYSYRGMYKNGKKHGFGVERTRDGEWWGNFFEDQRTGVGLLKADDGSLFVNKYNHFAEVVREKEIDI